MNVGSNFGRRVWSGRDEKMIFQLQYVDLDYDLMDLSGR